MNTKVTNDSELQSCAKANTFAHRNSVLSLCAVDVFRHETRLSQYLDTGQTEGQLPRAKSLADELSELERFLHCTYWALAITVYTHSLAMLFDNQNLEQKITNINVQNYFKPNNLFLLTYYFQNFVSL